ncbi:uncharacterized protein LOC108036815 [Drosophila biarmipes]|uniref:uncharacterized protein LOC108036815 n=1 Tax=Drosophila biarmipes TaxID=125945 RepID=UPI0007E68023|nr:uncharacterized protein LOC108036815 [Drosophila biarmipes]
MFGGSSTKYFMLWPPALQVLNFPSQRQQEQAPRPVVHFEHPPGHQLHTAPYFLRIPRTVPDADAPSSQETGNGPKTEVTFMRRCYMMAGLFSVTTAIMAMILSKAIPSEADLSLPGLICAVVSFMVLFVLCIGTKCRKLYWFSFILAGCFASLACVSVILVLLERNLVVMCLALLGASALIVTCYFAGAWLPRNVLPGEAALLLLVFFFVVASIFVLIMFVFTNRRIYQLLYFIFLVITVIPTALYHAQVVHGRRFKLPVHEFVICAVTVYLHFLLSFTALYFLIWTPGGDMVR